MTNTPAGDGTATEPPDPPQLHAALAAFDRGDFALTRRLLQPLAGHPDAAVATAAERLSRRLAPDRWALRFGLAALALLALVVGLYVR